METLRTMSVGIKYDPKYCLYFLRIICDHEDDGIERQDYLIEIPQVEAERMSKECKIEIV
jgi:hypothetical protein